MAKRLDDCCDGLIYRLFVAHIQRNDLVAFAQFLSHGRVFLRIAPAGYDRRAHCLVSQRNRTPDAAVCARDQRHFILQ